MPSLTASPTFGLVGVCRRDVLREQPQSLLALVVQPQVHLPPRLVLLRRLPLKVPLTVTHPQVVRVLRKPLKQEESNNLLNFPRDMISGGDYFICMFIFLSLSNYWRLSFYCLPLETHWLSKIK